MSTEIIPDQDPSQIPPVPRSASNPKPKGILKNAAPPPGAAQQSLRWDEANIQSTEFPEGTFTKITEPKTPYVRYNPLTDEVEGEIPNLDLNGHFVPSSPTLSSSPQISNISGPSSRRTSFSSAGRSGRSGSAGSSRSTSFNLPEEIRSDLRASGSDNGVGDTERGEEVEFEEEMDEETARKHAEFLRARGRHYSNEAEAMKRAARLIAEEDDVHDAPEMPRQGDDDDGDEPLEDATARKVSINGVHH
ncbi:hypothetical protein D9757_001266 [Collybiopsis confluens]|uniref:Uncharacterized protein n=1 Tax=Collybiopsis confluens TaxID=2823264 RepID=A0A8H5MGK2_9AGAR|nr:hypothetical protein D9757_001266 [Collybiopsis confluens]